MTKEQLKEKLQKYSPFQIEGSGKDTYEFVNNDEIYINGHFWTKYVLDDTKEGLQIKTVSVMPFHKNVLIDFAEDEESVIVNHDGNKLIQYPDNLRHSAAIEGFFVMKSLIGYKMK